MLIPGQADVNLGPVETLFVLDNDTVVGSSIDPAIGLTHTFMWTQASGRQELDVDPLDHTYALARSGNRFVGVNFVFDDDTFDGVEGMRLFVWDGTFHPLYDDPVGVAYR